MFIYNVHLDCEDFFLNTGKTTLIKRKPNRYKMYQTSSKTRIHQENKSFQKLQNQLKNNYLISYPTKQREPINPRHMHGLIEDGIRKTLILLNSSWPKQTIHLWRLGVVPI